MTRLRLVLRAKTALTGQCNLQALHRMRKTERIVVAQGQGRGWVRRKKPRPGRRKAPKGAPNRRLAPARSDHHPQGHRRRGPAPPAAPTSRPQQTQTRPRTPPPAAAHHGAEPQPDGRSAGLAWQRPLRPRTTGARGRNTAAPEAAPAPADTKNAGNTKGASSSRTERLRGLEKARRIASRGSDSLQKREPGCGRTPQTQAGAVDSTHVHADGWDQAGTAAGGGRAADLKLRLPAMGAVAPPHPSRGPDHRLALQHPNSTRRTPNDAPTTPGTPRRQARKAGPTTRSGCPRQSGAEGQTPLPPWRPGIISAPRNRTPVATPIPGRGLRPLRANPGPESDRRHSGRNALMTSAAPRRGKRFRAAARSYEPGRVHRLSIKASQSFIRHKRRGIDSASARATSGPSKSAATNQHLVVRPRGQPRSSRGPGRDGQLLRRISRGRTRTGPRTELLIIDKSYRVRARSEDFTSN